MSKQEIANIFFREILKLHQNDNLPLQVKFEELYSFLNKIFVHITEKERLQFSTQFARIAFACHKYDLSPRTQWYVHEFRNICKAVRYNKIEFQKVFYQLGLKALSDTLASVYEADILPEISAILPNDGFYKKSPVEAIEHKHYARVVVLEIREKEEILLCQDEEVPEGLVKVKYNETGVNEFFTASINSLKKIWQGQASINLLDISIDTKGIYYPKVFVLEPDYLLDVSAIANCFVPKAEPMLHLLKKFVSFEATIPIAVGNIANFLLDELMNDSNVDFQKIFPQVFKSNPIGFTVYNDNDIQDIYLQSQRHFQHLREMVKTGFRGNDIEPRHCYLEPSFYSEQYGIQGRLDVWYENRRNRQNSAIVELKSGQPFMPNIYGISESHYMQALMYDLLIKSVFKQSDPRNYILYSKMPMNPLRFAPAVKAKQYEAIRLRNSLVSIEQTLVHLHSKKNNSTTIIDFLNPDSLPQFSGFNRKDLERFHQVFSAATVLERDYFLSFVSFTAREHQLAKTGVQGIENLNGLASLWLNHYTQKNDNFEIISHLKTKPNGNKAKENEPLVTFLKTEGKTNHLANFRIGDIAILYPANDPEKGDTALQNQIFKCTLLDITKTEVTIRLRSRQFNDSLFENREQFWVIEHDTMDHSFNAMYQGLFAFLKSNTFQKNLLFTLDAPRKPMQSPAEIHLGKIADGMTDEQKNILKKAIVAQDYFLLWGPPGTGKTSIMLRNLVYYYKAKTSQNILLLAYTNRAVDEICEAIESIGGDIKEIYIRIGSRHSSNIHFHDNLFDKKIEAVTKRKELKNIIDQHRIFVATVASMSNKLDLLQLKQFDTVIIDEASQILEPMLVGLLTHFKKFILVGDHKQLPAVVSQEVEQSSIWQKDLLDIGLTNMRDSLFERLFLRCRENKWHHAYDMLSYQGRMHQDIMHFANEFFYENRLNILPAYCKVDQSSPLQCGLPNTPTKLEKHLANHRLIFIATPVDEKSRTRKTNRYEAEVIAQLVDSYSRIYEVSGFRINHHTTLGVITPYRAQIAQIRQELESYGKKYEDFSVDTVERYQGSAREVILLSLCLNHVDQLASLVSLSTDGMVDRKLNVALTRARKHLVIVGNEALLRQSDIYDALLDYINEMGGVFEMVRLEAYF
jgi:DNA replication ATP-dependent helicase Dna2